MRQLGVVLIVLEQKNCVETVLFMYVLTGDGFIRTIVVVWGVRILASVIMLCVVLLAKVIRMILVK